MSKALTPTALMAVMLTGAQFANAQTAPAPSPTPAPAATAPDDEEAIVLSPFTVDADKDTGYAATQTLAGTRIRTDLADVGSSISVLTKEFMNDVGGYNNQSVLSFALNTEVAGTRGNFSAGKAGEAGRITEQFANPNDNTRVRGLDAADNTRNFFLSDIPWDGYNISRVDLQRGPNAILFGLGSPAGIVNVSTNAPSWKNRGQIDLLTDKWGTYRGNLDYNRVLLKKQLAVRFDLVDSHQKFQQKPAFVHDRRAYGAVRFAPEALNQDGNTFEISVNAEHGEISANYPRVIPPQDYFSSYWKDARVGGTNQRTVNVFRDFWSGGNYPYSDNPDTGVSGYGGGTYSLFGPGPTVIGNGGTAGGFTDFRNIGTGALNKNGVPQWSTATNDGSAPWLYRGNGPSSGMWRLATPEEYSRSDTVGNLAFKSLGAAAYKPQFVNDPSVFDFYNNLIDGPNKHEGKSWNAYTVDLQQSFMKNLFSYQLTAYREDLHSNNLNLLSWWGNGLYMDINERLPDGSANPNLGRLYLNNAGVTSAGEEDKHRHAYRGQVNTQYDFAAHSRSTLARILGSHSITGVVVDEGFRSSSRSFSPYELGYDWLNSRDYNSPLGGTVGGSAIYYVSGDIRGTGGKNIHASTAGSSFVDWSATSRSLYYFDNTWIAGSSVDPKAPWANPNDPTNIKGPYLQNVNPANYRGWTHANVPFGTYQSRAIDPGTGVSWRDSLTTGATLNDYRVRSAVGVWQGAFWNRSVIGVFGWRSDTARNYLLNSGFNTTIGTDPRTGAAYLGSDKFNYERGLPDSITTHTKNWSIMTHLNKFVPNHDVLPFNVRLYYNQGENFKPVARIDWFGRSLAAPGGETKEYAIALSTKDDKYSVRLTKYKTSVQNATYGTTGPWYLGQILGGAGGSDPAAHIKDAYPAAYARRILQNLPGDGEAYWTASYPGWPSYSGLVNAANDWMKFEQEFKAKFPAFVNSWFAASGSAAAFGSGDKNSLIPSASAPPGAVYTQDTKSEGYELEFTANPTKNWRITANATKADSKRANVLGEMAQVFAFVDNAIATRPLGTLPIWWDGNTNGIKGGVSPYNVLHGDYLGFQVANGQSVGELPKYAYNIVTSYDFTNDVLKGFGVGASYQWQDSTVIGYTPIYRKDPVKGSYYDSLDVNNPVRSPSDHTVGLWVKYKRKLSDKLDWTIQLNLFNVGQKNKLIPIQAGIDIDKMVALQNTPGFVLDEKTKVPMKTTNWRIKDGLSWQLTNTFEF